MSLQVTFDDEVAKAYVELVAANVPVTEIRDLTQRVSPSLQRVRSSVPPPQSKTSRSLSWSSEIARPNDSWSRR